MAQDLIHHLMAQPSRDESEYVAIIDQSSRHAVSMHKDILRPDMICAEPGCLYHRFLHAHDVFIGPDLFAIPYEED